MSLLWQQLEADGQLSCPAMLVSLLRYVLLTVRSAEVNLERI